MSRRAGLDRNYGCRSKQLLITSDNYTAKSQSPLCCICTVIREGEGLHANPLNLVVGDSSPSSCRNTRVEISRIPQKYARNTSCREHRHWCNLGPTITKTTIKMGTANRHRWHLARSATDTINSHVQDGSSCSAWRACCWACRVSPGHYRLQ